MGVISWNYDGGANLSATFDTVAGRTYRLASDAGSNVDGVASGPTLTLTQTDCSDPGGTDFVAQVLRIDALANENIANNIFTFGTASTTGTFRSATWSYDGGTGAGATISVSFNAPTSDGYQLNIAYVVGGSFATANSSLVSGPGPITLTVHPSSFPLDAATHVSAYVFQNGGNFPDIVARLFTVGSSGVGTEGNPGSNPPPAPVAQGISIAFGEAAYETAPEWVRIDDPNVPSLTMSGSSRNVVGWSIDRGRTYELDKTQAGTAQLTLLDTSGIFDPTNAASPLFGMIGPMLQSKINILDPVNGNYHDLFTGFLESWDWTSTPDEKLMTIQVGLVDGFEPLTRCEIQPDMGAGTTAFAQLLGAAAPQVRIDALLDLAGWPNATGWRKVNSGNVYIPATIYNVQTSVLSAIQDTADAEFPGVANVFMTKQGELAFYGRYPRFVPENYPQDVQFWTCGDRGAVSAFGGASIKDIEWTLDQKNVYNAALCYPFGIAQTAISGQYVTDVASVGQFGIRTLSLPDLIEAGQPASTGDNPLQPALSANAVALAYAKYIVDNYAQPKMRISKLTFESALYGPLLASAATWALLVGVEIGDIITVYTSNAGGGGFGKGAGAPTVPTPAQFFVEGIHYVAAFVNDVPILTLSLDVSPRGWFSFAPWAN